MLLLIPDMNDEKTKYCLNSVCKDLGINYNANSNGWVDVDDNTDPVKLKELMEKLTKLKMLPEVPVRDKTVIAIIKATHQIFILSQNDEFVWDYDRSKRFNYSKYLVKKLGVSIKNMRERFSKAMYMPLGEYYEKVREQYIFTWIGEKYKVGRIAEMALFKERRSFSKYFKEITGKTPREYEESDKDDFICKKKCKFNPFWVKFPPPAENIAS